MDPDDYALAQEILEEVRDIGPEERENYFRQLDHPETVIQVVRELLTLDEEAARMFPLGAPAQQDLPVRIQQYVVGDALGHGGMGEVFAAWDETLQRHAAIKRLRVHTTSAQELRTRLRREARVLSRLDHPNICRVYDYVQSDIQDFLVMERIDGQTLLDALEKGIEPRNKWKIAEQILEALASAHRCGIIHRDLKSSNVMLTQNGTVKVLDFGLARSEEHEPPQTTPARPNVSSSPFPDSGSSPPLSSYTHAGTILGTIQAMSPEQARGEPLTIASDLYSAGLLLHELFGETPPYPPQRSSEEFLALVRNGQTRPLDHRSSSLVELIEALKQQNPAERPTAAAALHKLRRILDQPRRRRLQAAVAAVVLIAAGAWVKYTWDLDKERSTAVRAQTRAENMIGFLLNDFREKLVPLGRLELLESVADKAQEYFDEVDQESFTEEELARHCQMLEQLALLQLARGDVDEALDVAAQGIRKAKLLVAQNTEDADRQQRLAHSLFALGDIYFQAEDLPRALQAFDESASVCEAMAARFPEDLRWRKEVADSHINRGGILQRMGDLPLAEQHLRLAVDQWELATQQNPADVTALTSHADALSWLGALRRDQGDVLGAEQQFRDELRVRKKIEKQDKKNRQWQYLTALSRWTLSSLLCDTGRYAEALDDAEIGRDTMEELCTFDPSNLEWRRSFALALYLTGRVYDAMEDPEFATLDLEQSEALLEELVQEDPDHPEWQIQRSKVSRLLDQIRQQIIE